MECSKIMSDGLKQQKKRKNKIETKKNWEPRFFWVNSFYLFFPERKRKIEDTEVIINTLYFLFNHHIYSMNWRNLIHLTTWLSMIIPI